MGLRLHFSVNAKRGILNMVYYRSCPKCRGDMHTRRDFYGDFRECLQCGLMQDLEIKPDSDAEVDKMNVLQAGKKHEAA